TPALPSPAAAMTPLRSPAAATETAHLTHHTSLPDPALGRLCGLRLHSDRGGDFSSTPCCQRQQQLRTRETPSVQQLREWYAGRGRSGGAGPCTYFLRTGTRSGEVCGLPHTTQCCFGRLTDAWRTQFPDAVELPRWHDLLLQNVPIFDIDFDAILAAMYALADITEGDCYLRVPPDPGTVGAALGASAAAALGASASAAPSAAYAAAGFAGDSLCCCWFCSGAGYAAAIFAGGGGGSMLLLVLLGAAYAAAGSGGNLSRCWCWRQPKLLLVLAMRNGSRQFWAVPDSSERFWRS
ncbi:unnamed protein product, partial [Closterium sp. NIES-53]